jgi:hypothetical protein
MEASAGKVWKLVEGWVHGRVMGLIS